MFRCPLDEVTAKSPIAFKAHLDSAHSSDLTADEKRRLLESASTTVDDHRDECPICGGSFSEAAKLHNHLANHFERFAAFALSRSHYSKENDEAESDASNGARGSRIVSTDFTNASQISCHSQVPDAADRNEADWEPQHALATAYEYNGQISEAVKMLEHVVKVQEQTLIETHPDRLASQHALAGAYESNRQIERAVQLLSLIHI